MASAEDQSWQRLGRYRQLDRAEPYQFRPDGGDPECPERQCRKNLVVDQHLVSRHNHGSSCSHRNRDSSAFDKHASVLLGVLAGGKISVTAGTHMTTYTSTGTDTVGDLLKAINTNSFGSAQVTAALNSHGNLVLTSKNTTDVILVGGLYASNIGFGVGNETFKPTKTTAPAPAPAPQTSYTTSSNAKTAKSYSTPATEMVGTAASLLSDSGAGGTLVDMLA